MTVINKVGLEAEYFLTNKEGGLLFPQHNGFQSDEFCILGEFRALPGETRVETVTNFMQEWLTVNEQAKAKGMVIDISPFKEIDLEFYSKIMKTMGTKEISQAQNIYGTDIVQDSDAIITRGKITGHRLSIGLHIHFSSYVEHTQYYTADDYWEYEPAYLPVSFINSELPELQLELYKRKYKVENQVNEVKATVSRITKPVLWNFIDGLDEELYPKYKPEQKLKFRQPGFYELKGHGGFEYRSLPFSQAILDDIYNIVDYSFGLLENLDL